ncbi:precorrin-6Y C5,15-methyltransferase (decarboxylating) [Saccharopolyspora kobensis]|uniref:Precorrin-6Y C5,15-methyltransferase (Decarboxylating) n=1 Tax=Saccharopolyspora kobensis TaxID=146035 RepID=A0A1H6BUI0_9PSEU|nr:precorrin-6y C5,15-methyltransferase (decarboxylating) subunit CbiE [Saccharopolyspora kobensis]SEG64391.1 precorrin-6Y C5,15-methyltransferase (decarboxylating) [Saccharopolyspora kobensis]SFC17081.1 precorrin-6Y C5,15-methyltransferase (decarboxylating) [Saccharopolyspora kobensis]
MSVHQEQPEPVHVVGIGADGAAGLSPHAQAVVNSAEVLFGSSRQLDLVPGATGQRVAWPTPLLPALPGLLAEHAGRSICVLASGDPMFYGIGATLVKLLGPERVRIIAHPSSLSLACARLGWPVQETAVVSLVGRPVELLHPRVQPGNRLLVLSSDGSTPDAVAALLRERGFGPSSMTVLSDLGSEREQRTTSTADSWEHSAGPLNVIAIECRAAPGARTLPVTPGLPDEAFEHDGQLTKRDVRAITLARLAPCAGQLLWDVGAGAGSIAIEWMRSDPSCRAIAIEHREDRAQRITANAKALGVPGIQVITGAVPHALDGLDAPDAIFVGGGGTAPGALEECWSALRPGGRLVVNAVTLELETLVADWYRRIGGELVRISVERAAPIGGFTGWRPAMPVTQWVVDKR